MNQEQITVITTDCVRQQQEYYLRCLWRDCFNDPQPYENFYFENIYPHNTVYCIPEKGMLHRNPYHVWIRETNYPLSYIVGVATNPSDRRRGIMKSLLEKMLADLCDERAPFTYLMPADVAYYIPFDFVSICESEKEQMIIDAPKNSAGNENLLFVEYDTLIGRSSNMDGLFDRIGQMLSEIYDVYAVHDREYFDLLWKEKHCLGGNVIFCFSEEIIPDRFVGFFAYSKEGEQVIVEQYLFPDRMIADCLSGYTTGEITVFHRLPYMARVVCVETFLEVFADCFAQYEGKWIQITDPVLNENNGRYRLSLLDGTARVEKLPVVDLTGDGEDGFLQDVKMSVSELAAFVFGKQTGRPVNVFFAEIV